MKLQPKEQFCRPGCPRGRDLVVCSLGSLGGCEVTHQDDLRRVSRQVRTKPGEAAFAAHAPCADSEFSGHIAVCPCWRQPEHQPRPDPCEPQASSAQTGHRSAQTKHQSKRAQKRNSEWQLARGPSGRPLSTEDGKQWVWELRENPSVRRLSATDPVYYNGGPHANPFTYRPTPSGLRHDTLPWQ